MRKPAFVGGIVFIFLLIVTQCLNYFRYQKDHQEELNKTLHELNSISERFRISLRPGLAAAKTLSYVVKTQGVPTDFDSVAREIIGSSKLIDGLQLTKGGVVTHAYPKADEKVLIGFNILEDSTRKIEAIKAIQKKELFFAGPYKLIQGGEGVVGRLPIFIKGNFFGFATVLIRTTTLLREAGIDTTKAIIYSYQLSKTNPNTKKEEFFLSYPIPKNSDTIVSKEIADGDWKLYVWLKNESDYSFSLISFSVLGLMLSVIAGLFTQQALKKSQGKEARTIQSIKETVFNRINDKLVSLDNEWRYTFLNDAALADHPLGREHTLGKIIWNIHPEMKETIFWDKYHVAMATRKMVEVDSYYPPMDIWFSVKVYPDENGLTILYRDISEQKRKEIRLEENERTLALIFDNTVDVLFLLTVEREKFIFSRVNKSFLKATGLQVDQVIGLSVDQVIPEPSLSFALAQYRKAIGQKMTLTWEEITKYGNSHKVGIVAVTPVFNIQGDCNMLVGSVHDLTELKKATENLKLFADIVSTSDDAIVSKTIKGEITSWNRGAEKLFGFTADEIIGKHIYAIIPSDYQEEEKEIISKIWKGEFINHYETKRITKNGQLIDVSLTISPLRNDQGNITGASKILRDITYRKKIEMQLLNYAQELERSNKELEQFAYIASHDLQEPLRMVGSYMQLIEKRYKGKLDKDADEYIHFAVDGATRMKQLINDLLSYSRLNKDKTVTRVDLNEILKEVKLNLSARLKESNGTINFIDLPLIEANPTQMIQLFQNLISNALKFKREGIAPVIEIHVEKQNNQWLFSIRDNGIGIEEQYIEKIFVIFRQLHPKSTYGGTGIGLSIAKKIVEKHGGKIWFESELGQGTTFFFTLNSKA